eukprot:UN22593
MLALFCKIKHGRTVLLNPDGQIICQLCFKRNDPFVRKHRRRIEKLIIKLKDGNNKVKQEVDDFIDNLFNQWQDYAKTFLSSNPDLQSIAFDQVETTDLSQQQQPQQINNVNTYSQQNNPPPPQQYANQQYQNPPFNNSSPQYNQTHESYNSQQTYQNHNVNNQTSSYQNIQSSSYQSSVPNNQSFPASQYHSTDYSQNNHQPFNNQSHSNNLNKSPNPEPFPSYDPQPQNNQST